MLTRKKRRVIFILLSVLFVILGGALVGYSQGFRLSWSTLAVQKVGGLYIRSYPADALIFLDDEPIPNDSGLIQSGTLLNSLAPREYRVRIERDGYREIQQTVSVKPALVTELKYAVMIPLSTTPVETTLGTLRDFTALSNQQTFIEQGPTSTVYRGAVLPNATIMEIASDGSSAILSNRRSAELSLYHLPTNTTSSLTPLFAKITPRIQNTGRIVRIDDGSARTILAGDSQRLYLINTLSGGVEKLEDASRISKKSAIGPFLSSRFVVLWTVYDPSTDQSRIVIWDKFLKQRSEHPDFFKGKIIQLAWGRNGSIAVLQADGTLSIGNPNQELTAIARQAKEFLFNLDASMIAVRQKDSLEIISLDEEEDYWRFRIADLERVEKLAWYKDGRHLFLGYVDKVRFLDFTDVRLEHFYTLAQTTAWQYVPADNAFYFLTPKGQLQKIEFAGR
jgi:hypothetical protein